MKAPKDLNEFLECLKVDVDAIEKFKADYQKAVEEPDSDGNDFAYRGKLLMAEADTKEELYLFIKEFVNLYLR